MIHHTMKALTIIQPFAALIAGGDKRVENRTWSTSYRGPLAIHAGKAKRYGGASVTTIAEYYNVDAGTLQFGAVIAVAEVVACLELRTIRRGSVPESLQWLLTHEYVEGPFCWVLANVRPLAAPVPCNGAMGLWDWTPAGELVYAEAAGVLVPRG